MNPDPTYDVLAASKAQTMEYVEGVVRAGLQDLAMGRVDVGVIALNDAVCDLVIKLCTTEDISDMVEPSRQILDRVRASIVGVRTSEDQFARGCLESLRGALTDLRETIQETESRRS